MGQFDNAVIEFLTQPGAAVPIISDDDLFKKNLRSVFQKFLGVKREVLHSFSRPTAALKYLKQRLSRKQPTLLFCEGILGGRQTTDFIATIKTAYPELMIIALVAETRREDIAYLYEVGCNNVIAKPASANNILEKMAFTVRPQGKLPKLISMGKAMLRAGEYQKALTICQSVFKIKPGSPTGLMLVGDAHLGLGDRVRALEAYEQAHLNAHVFIEPIKRLAEFHKDHDEEAYLSYLNKLDKLSPLHAGRKRDIGVVHLHKGNTQKAEAYFDKAMEYANREATGIISGMAESIAGAVQDASPGLAEKYLYQALDAKGANLGRADLETFNRLGIALKAQGKWKDSISCYEKALEVAPRDEGLHYNLGMAYFEGRLMREAREACAKALELNPTLYRGNRTVSANLANVFYEVGGLEQALECIDHALELDPRNATALQLKKRIQTRMASKR